MQKKNPFFFSIQRHLEIKCLFACGWTSRIGYVSFRKFLLQIKCTYIFFDFYIQLMAIISVYVYDTINYSIIVNILANEGRLTLLNEIILDVDYV